jgi:tetratricopeptide (TPR) repeat protein
MQSQRVSLLCLRSAHLHRGNALSALGRDEEARASYLLVLPMIEKEPRSCRLDWERNSCFVNIGNTYSRQGNFVKANEYYDMAEKLGKDHVDAEHGNKVDGMALMIVSMRQRSFALKKAGKDDEAKKQMREVLEMQQKHDVETVKQEAELKIFTEKQAEKEKLKKEADAYAAAVAVHKDGAADADAAASSTVENLMKGLKAMAK